jgi:hypothetical protein
MDAQPLHVFLAPEVQRLLAENEVDLIASLRKQGLDAERKYSTDPAAFGREQTRDIHLVILASGASFYAISMGIAHILDALGRNRKVVVKGQKCIPVVSPEGEIVRDPHGKPILQWVEDSHLLEARQTGQDQSSLKVSIGGEVGLKIELTSGKA